MAWDRKKTFIPEGVMVKLAKEHEGYFAERRASDSEGDNNINTEVFEPFRMVMNIGLFSKDRKDPSKYLSVFDPPFELWVPYTEEDVGYANRVGRDLVLGWQNKSGQWVPFTQLPNEFKKIPDKCDRWAGYGIADVRKWDDPPIAWGT